MMILLTCIKQKHTDTTDDDTDMGDALQAVKSNLDNIKHHPVIVCFL